MRKVVCSTIPLYPCPFNYYLSTVLYSLSPHPTSTPPWRVFTHCELNPELRLKVVRFSFFRKNLLPDHSQFQFRYTFAYGTPYKGLAPHTPFHPRPLRLTHPTPSPLRHYLNLIIPFPLTENIRHS